MGASNGRIEFIYKVLETCSVVILEAKCGQITRNNFAQMMAELEACTQQNIANKLNLKAIHGVLSSQQEWHFWTYDGSNFRVSDSIAPFHCNEDTEIFNRFRIISILFGQFLDGYCLALDAFLRKSEEVGINEGKGEHHPSYAKWMQASQIANKAKAKALSAENEEDFMAVRHLLKKSFDSLPPDHNCDLRFPTQSNGILRCMEKVTLLKKKKTPQPVDECDCTTCKPAKRTSSPATQTLIEIDSLYTGRRFREIPAQILTAGLHCGQNDQDPHDATQPVMPQPSELANPRQGLSNR
ncbi:hypothetical protein PSTG_13776 [Puccinia striiformis f. sp. tritici PST-78]|uniref:Uncharacterized protein n=1 Tax=Puccinia striiformis f. sp. tritici PST-78 TaxID=1165861 RepID=A0A0L0V0Q6_9BASI|nr:hypothetical protein PSTG_13776 [Puccinia striiformis f. sp. tritici PST-78]